MAEPPLLPCLPPGKEQELSPYRGKALTTGETREPSRHEQGHSHTKVTPHPDVSLLLLCPK